MQKTKYDGVYYIFNKKSEKVYIGRIWHNGKEYKRRLGKEPQVTASHANRIRLEMIDEMSNPKDVLTTKTFKECFEEYRDATAPSRNPEWIKNYTLSFNKHLKTLANRQATLLLPKDFQSILNTMLAKGYAVNSVKQIKEIASGTYKYLIRNKMAVENPAQDLELPKFDNRRELKLTLDQIRELVKTIVDYEDGLYRAFFIFLLHGRRKGEVKYMEWDNIDFDAMLYHVPFERNKIRKNMEYPMTPLLATELQKLPKLDKCVFISKLGKNLSNGGIDHHWQKIKSRVGLENEDVRLHDFRHFIGMVSVNDGLSLEMIGKALGHLSTQTTKRYSSVRLHSAATVIDNFFDRVGNCQHLQK